jgi:hypothetical protein
MPGVAGALFRKEGRYSAMRKGISYTPQDIATDEEVGSVTIKLFNLILKELGPFFLAKGVWIDGRVAQEFFSNLPEALFEKIKRVEINGNTTEFAALSTYEWSAKRVLLKIESE